jgi:vacuolar-type H+-ATPase subunit E/Vma4
VAIDDIVGRIRADAEGEAAAVVAEAESEAARVTAEARARAEADAARTLAREAARARRDADTLLANARLQARDATLAAHLELDNDALAAAEAALVALPDAEYAALLARGVAASSIDEETVLLGTADMARLRATLPSALAAAGVQLTIGDVPADIAHGVVLVSDRVRVEVSPAALVGGQRDDLLAQADRLLFGQEA